jgi:hypothetical protein
MSMIVDINDFSNGSIDVSNPQDPKWNGTGVFDIIMKAANENIKIQNQTSRITGAEYAEVYLGTMQSAIAEAMKFLLNKDQIIKDLELKQAQIDATETDTLIKQEQSAKEIEVKQAQIDVGLEEKRLKAAQADAYPLQASKDALVKQANVDLLNRQKEGFDDNKYQKLFEAQMNAWALMFSSGLLTDKPRIISNDSASTLYDILKS